MTGPEPPAVRAVSVATIETLPAAAVMAASVRAHQLDWELEVALIAGRDQAERRAPSMPEGVVLTSVEEALGVPVSEALAHHREDELVVLLVAELLRRRILDRPGPVVHLPATAWAVGPLDALIEPFMRRPDLRRPVVLVPRLTLDPPEDGREPSNNALRVHGRIHSELLAVDGSEGALSFLNWWTARGEQVLGDPRGTVAGLRPEHRHWLRRSLELAAARNDVATLRDGGVGLSAWNLHEHRLDDGPADRLLTIDGGVPVALLDLAGFSPDRPWRLHPELNRTRLRWGTALARMIGDYAEQLRSAGPHDATHRAAVGRTLPNGLLFDDTLRTLYGIALAEGTALGDPLTAGGAQALLEWLRGPAPRGGTQGVNRYVFQRVLLERPDVVAAYPELDGRDGIGLVRWCESSGQAEMGLPALLMPTLPAAPETAPARATDVDVDVAPNEETVARATDGRALSVRVSGYMGHVLGLGAAARGYAEALGAAGVQLSTATVSLDHQRPIASQVSYGRHAFADLTGDGGHGFELVCVNPDELPAFVERVGDDYFHGRRIGVWGWETNTIPSRWGPAFAFVDEIWTYSRFVADNLRAVSGDLPVQALAPPVSPPDAGLEPNRLGVEDGFLFLFVFDYSSTNARKNPVGLIEAFTRAFADGEGPRLLIKTINGERLPLAEDEVLWAAGDRTDIHVVDRSLEASERDALMLACDCYVSLHRSEGFGLTMAEAMSVGKPVIATRYSGNLDFMTDENSFLVDYELTRVGADVQIYPADGEWAEPDLDHAAALMRRVYEDSDEAARVGERARADVTRALSPAATGAAMRRRLLEVAAEAV